MAVGADQYPLTELQPAQIIGDRIIKKYHIKTFGCQMNTADSSFMDSVLRQYGLIPLATEQGADLVIVNTCSVRDHAENRARSYIGRLALPGFCGPVVPRVIIAGCMAQREGKALRHVFPNAILILGAKEIESFPGKIESLMDTAATPNRSDIPVPICASVVAMRGCQNFCSYCIVPSVRGPETSRPLSDVLDEATGLMSRGARDITLLGQNVNSYRSGDADFSDLLIQTAALPGACRLRFMTSHPKDLSERLISVIGRGAICEHIHLPLQSGSDRILDGMNRGYTLSLYRQRVDALRNRVPRISITTDILVGFPGENAGDIDSTIHAIETIGFDMVYAFKYSPRPGTTAATMTDSVTRAEKEARLAAVLAAADTQARLRSRALAGRPAEVLVEGLTGPRAWGKTRTGRVLEFPAGQVRPGDLITVVMSDTNHADLHASHAPCA